MRVPRYESLYAGCVWSCCGACNSIRRMEKIAAQQLTMSPLLHVGVLNVANALGTAVL